MIWPLWPGSAVLVSILLLAPGRIWPILIPAAFATFAVYDLSVGVPLRSIAWFVPANTVQVLTSAMCLRYFFDGIPRLNSLKALAKYWIFAVILAPSGAAFLSAAGLEAGNYWEGWRICFLSEALAFATLTPTILSWIGEGPAWVREPRARHLEAAALIAGLVLLSYFTFNRSEGPYLPALLYSPIPFLLWAALRFGWIGICTSVILVCIFAIRGAVHNQGPFSEYLVLKDMLSLQLFLTLAAMPFMALAAVVEELVGSSKRVRESEERLRLATQAGKMYAYEWDVASDVIIRSQESVNVLGFSHDEQHITRQQLSARVHPDDRELFNTSLDQVTRENPTSHINYRMLRPDGSIVWLEKRARAFFDEQGKLQRMIGMVEDITERKRTEEALRTTEERLRLAQQAAQIGSFEWNIQTGANTWTPELEAIYGLAPGEFGGTQTDWKNQVHPGDRAAVQEWIQESMKTGQPMQGEWRVVWPDKSVHWVAGWWRVLRNESGEPLRMVGINIDVTERKLAEQALAEMSRKLIESQEQERNRIGRELHDDINQRLAMLALELEQLQGNPSEVQTRLQELRKRTTDISDDVQALSHDLHSSKLEYLGAVAGIRSWCREFAERQQMEIDFNSNFPSVLPFEIGVCLFRVLQEVLHNAVKHSGVKRIDVQLTEKATEVHLIVSDSGRGFDVEAATQGKGLGLTSMRERVRLVNGIVEIHSKPMAGTTIHVRVPLRSETGFQRSAG